MLPKPSLVNQFLATPRGQLNRTGPIANSSDISYTPTRHSYKKKILVTRPEYPPYPRDTRRTTPVALWCLWSRKISLLHPHFFPKNGLSQSKETPNKGGIAEKLASEALSRYRGRRTQ